MLFYSRKCILLSLLVVVSLFLAAVTPGVVYAEGDVPEIPPADSPVEPAAPEEDTGSVVEALAESGATIVEASGASVPLASQAALDVICEPDPWFYCSVGCPGGKSGFYPTINDALAGWAAKKGYGYIYLESGYFSDQAVTIVGTDPRMPSLKGIKWQTPGAGVKPVMNGLIDISQFANGFTLWGVSVNVSNASPAVSIHDNKGTIRLIDVDVHNSLGAGIQINNRGAISLDDVTSSGNGFEGATLNNRYYHPLLLKYVFGGNIAIKNSIFDGNGYLNDGVNYPGLIVLSNGTITLNGVSASGNYGSGAEVGAYGTALTIKNSVFTNNQDYPDLPDNGYGLVMYEGSPAIVLLENVSLNGNDSDGAFLRTTKGITLNMVTASLNDLFGVRIEGFPGNVDNRAVGAKNVTVLNSTFDGNYEANLSIRANGLVTIRKLTSINAGRSGPFHGPLPYGLYINNAYFSSYQQPVNIQGAVISNNYYKGVYVISKRTITVAGIVSVGNGANGMYLKNDEEGSGGVNVSSLLGLNQFNGNTGVGLVIYTKGNVSMRSVQADGNLEGGVSIHGNGLASNVTMYGIETSGNLGPLNTGLLILTSGVVTLDKAVSSGNVGEGIYIDNTSSAYARTVRITNTTANGNGKEGVKVNSVGAISLANVITSGNTLEGADLQNFLTPLVTQLPKGISVARSTFDGNGGMGLYMLTQRGITLYSIQASGNKANLVGTGLGVYAVNTSSTINSSVVITGLNHADGNDFTGLYVVTNGKLTASGITASGNGGFGVDSTSAAGVLMSAVQANTNSLGGVSILDYGTVGNVTMNNIETIGNLADTGLKVVTSGVVLLNKLTSLQNTGDGIYVDNSASTVARQVRITNATASNNPGYGVKVTSVGLISLANVTANDNTLKGADLQNSLTPHLTQVPQAINVVRSTFDGNHGMGLYAVSQRTITLNTVNANGNKADASGDGVGVYAVNTASVINNPILVVGINHFYSNDSTGLYLESDGPLTISGVTASLNGGHGMQAITAKGAIITTSLFGDNQYSGLVLDANGVVKVSGVTISKNGATSDADGLVITDLGGKVYIYKNYIIQNGGWGMNIDVLNDQTDVYKSPYAVISENDTAAPFDDGEYWIH